MRSILLSVAVSIVIAVSVASPVSAAALAFDSAADPAYAPYLNMGTLPAGINGGYGWGPWKFSGVLPNVCLLASSTNGFSWQSPVTSPGAVWVIPGLGGIVDYGLVTRYFDGSLAVGQTLTFDFANVPTIDILSSDGTGDTYEIDPGNPDRVWFEHSRSSVFFQTDISDTQVGGHISITPIDAGDAALSITSYGPLGGTELFEMPYADVDGVAFEADTRDSTGFVNNLSITPEPASAALIAAAGMGLLLRRSRRGRSSNAPGVSF